MLCLRVPLGALELPWEGTRRALLGRKGDEPLRLPLLPTNHHKPTPTPIPIPIPQGAGEEAAGAKASMTEVGRGGGEAGGMIVRALARGRVESRQIRDRINEAKAERRERLLRRRY